MTERKIIRIAPKKPQPPICQYCGQQAVVVDGEQLYGSAKYRGRNFWVCKPCGAWTGCHGAGSYSSKTINNVEYRNYRMGQEPLGTLANAELRAIRQMCHQLFDDIWRERHVTRYYAYRALAYRLGIPIDDCHIAMFDTKQCEKMLQVIAEVRQYCIGRRKNGRILATETNGRDTERNTGQEWAEQPENVEGGRSQQ